MNIRRRTDNLPSNESIVEIKKSKEDDNDDKDGKDDKDDKDEKVVKSLDSSFIDEIIIVTLLLTLNPDKN